MRCSWCLWGFLMLACGCTVVPPRSGSAHVSAGVSHGSVTESSEAAASAPEPRDFSSSIARQRASVVTVVAIRPSADLDMDEEARIQLFHQLNPDSPGAALPRTASRVDASGILMTSDGYILTNAHVVEGASIVNVMLITGEEYPARRVGTDLETDVAVLKIEGRNLPVAAIGDSKHLRAGEWVAAIGAPFGFEQSVAVGVVSALARNLPGQSYTPYIQTDLNLNPGDSGGPLIDIHGAVVGVNAEVALRDGTSTGISFAIPIELAERIAAELMRNGRIERAELGIGLPQPLAHPGPQGC
jgi:serine protease Do